MMKNKLRVIKSIDCDINFEVTNVGQYKKTKQVVFFVTYNTILIINFKFIDIELSHLMLKKLERAFSTEFGEGRLVFYSGNGEPAPKLNIKYNIIKAYNDYRRL